MQTISVPGKTPGSRTFTSTIVGQTVAWFSGGSTLTLEMISSMNSIAVATSSGNIPPGTRKHNTWRRPDDRRRPSRTSKGDGKGLVPTRENMCRQHGQVCATLFSGRELVGFHKSTFFTFDRPCGYQLLSYLSFSLLLYCFVLVVVKNQRINEPIVHLLDGKSTNKIQIAKHKCLDLYILQGIYVNI